MNLILFIFLILPYMVLSDTYFGYQLLDPSTGRTLPVKFYRHKPVSKSFVSDLFKRQIGDGSNFASRQFRNDVFDSSSDLSIQDPENANEFKAGFYRRPSRFSFFGDFNREYTRPTRNLNYDSSVYSETQNDNQDYSAYFTQQLTPQSQPAHVKRKRYPYYGRKKRSAANPNDNLLYSQWVLLDPLTGRPVNQDIDLEPRNRLPRFNSQRTSKLRYTNYYKDRFGNPSYKRYKKNPYRG